MSRYPEPCRACAGHGIGHDGAQCFYCAGTGQFDYKCFCCGADWHSGAHDSAGCMKSLAESYEFMRAGLEGLIYDRTTFQNAKYDYAMAVDEAKDWLRKAEQA